MNLPVEAAGFNVLLVISPKRAGSELARRLIAGPSRVHAVAVTGFRRAVSTLKSRRFDAVVCDLDVFPKLSAAMSRRPPGDRSVPVIVLAPPDVEVRVAAALEQGAAGFLVKAGNYGRLLPLVVERAAEAVSSWEEIGHVVRHEINNPLTGILGNAELVLSAGHDLPDEVRSRLTTIVHLAVRLRDLVKGLEDRLRRRSSAPDTAPGRAPGSRALPASASPQPG